MKQYPMGYHITWGTYGTRLHGSCKPHVDRTHNQYRGPLAPTDPDREIESRERMSEDTTYLAFDERRCVEEAIQDVAKRYGWTIHAIAIQADHSHVVITAIREGEQLREALKAVASRALNKRFGRKTWWAENGSAKYLWERSYFENAVNYVEEPAGFLILHRLRRRRPAAEPLGSRTVGEAA